MAIRKRVQGVGYKIKHSAWKQWLFDEIINSLRPSDAYMRQLNNHHWLR